MPADISIRKQREAVEAVVDDQALHNLRFPSTIGTEQLMHLSAAALTLAKVERGEYVLKEPEYLPGKMKMRRLP